MNDVFRAACTAAALALTMTALPSIANAAATSSAGCRGFDGTWKTMWQGGGAPVTMKLSGGSGSYAYNDGKIKGTVSQQTLTGTYKENDGATGVVKFTLSGDGNAFRGYYILSGSNGDHIPWNGTCTGP